MEDDVFTPPARTPSRAGPYHIHPPSLHSTRLGAQKELILWGVWRWPSGGSPVHGMHLHDYNDYNSPFMPGSSLAWVSCPTSAQDPPTVPITYMPKPSGLFMAVHGGHPTSSSRFGVSNNSTPLRFPVMLFHFSEHLLWLLHIKCVLSNYHSWVVLGQCINLSSACYTDDIRTEHWYSIREPSPALAGDDPWLCKSNWDDFSLKAGFGLFLGPF